MKTKKIFRVEKTKNYSVISNLIFQDQRISWGAKGVMGYALTKPDDWSLYITEVIKQGTDKNGRVSKYFKELRLAGYMEYKKYYEKGKICKTEYIIHENPLHTNDIKIVTRYKEKKLKPKILQQEKLKIEILKIEKSPLLNTDNILNTEKELSTKEKERREKKEIVDIEEIKNSPPSPDTSDEFDLRKKRYEEVKNIISDFFRVETKSTYNGFIDDPWIYKLVDLVGSDYIQVANKLEIWKNKKNSIDNPFWKKSQPTAFYLVKLWNELIPEPKRDNRGEYVPRNNI